MKVAAAAPAQRTQSDAHPSPRAHRPRLPHRATAQHIAPWRPQGAPGTPTSTSGAAEGSCLGEGEDLPHHAHVHSCACAHVCVTGPKNRGCRGWEEPSDAVPVALALLMNEQAQVGDTSCPGA